MPVEPELCPPCAVIIEGEEGLVAIERYDASSISPKADTARLKGQVEASCELAQFSTLVNLQLGRSVPLAALGKILEFHKAIPELLTKGVAKIEAAADELKALNYKLSSKTNLS
jgi:hypothetical protein